MTEYSRRGTETARVGKTFVPGDRVVLPPYGLGTVCGTCFRPVAGHEQAYYELSFTQSTARAYVPVAAPQGAGLRAALTGRDLPRLLEGLRRGAVDLPRQWAARQRIVSELVSSGDPFRLAALIAELHRWQTERGLPDLDHQAFRRAVKLLDEEISALNGVPAQQIRALLRRALGESGAA